MSLLTTVKHELQQVGLVILYFLFCFAIVLTLKKLFLASYEIEFYGLSVAAVGALVVGKVVVILDKTRVGTRFDHGNSLVIAALYKTLCYGVATFVVLFAEHVFHVYRESGALGQAIAEVWAHRDRNVILAKVLCIGLAFAGYHLYAGLDRRLGRGILWRTVWSRG